MTIAERTCARCHAIKAASEFSRQAKRRDGLHIWCKDCCRDYNRLYAKRPDAHERRLEWRRANDTYDRAARVQYLYGLSPAEYEALLVLQDHRCAICRTDTPGGRWDTWHVDHDHQHCPGKRGCSICVRGLLCSNCNLALGHLHHDPAIIQAAAAYASRGLRVGSAIPH